MLGTVVALFETEQYSFGFFFFGSGFSKCFNAIPGVRRGKDLDVMKSSGLKNKTPQVGQDAVIECRFSISSINNMRTGIVVGILA